MTESEIEKTTRGRGVGPGARRRRQTLVQKPVMLSPADVLALDALADALGRSRSDLIREAVRKVWLGAKGRRAA